MKILERILDLLFPPKCPFCGRVREHGGVCPQCEKALPWTAENDACWNISGGLRCAAPLWYEDLAREGILRFKFQGASASAEALGELLARCAAEHLSGEFDTVTWVPVSKKRLRKRGYDQAELLARAACRLWDTEPFEQDRGQSCPIRHLRCRRPPCQCAGRLAAAHGSLLNHFALGELAVEFGLHDVSPLLFRFVERHVALDSFHFDAHSRKRLNR